MKLLLMYIQMMKVKLMAVKNLAEAFEYSEKPIKVKSRVLEMYGI